MSYFFTGSQVYGTPTEESDIDLAILEVGERLSDRLAPLANKSLVVSRDGHDSFKFGRLNILVFQNEKEFDAWKEATENLKTRRPVTREQAIAEIDKQLAKIGGDE